MNFDKWAGGAAVGMELETCGVAALPALDATEASPGRWAKGPVAPGPRYLSRADPSRAARALDIRMRLDVLHFFRGESPNPSPPWTRGGSRDSMNEQVCMNRSRNA